MIPSVKNVWMTVFGTVLVSAPGAWAQLAERSDSIFPAAAARQAGPISLEELDALAASGAPKPPPNDACESAIKIAGEGEFPFDGTGSTAGAGNDCLDDTALDVWYCWTAPATGEFTVETCGRTLVDTEVAVFEGCSCPVGPPLACDGRIFGRPCPSQSSDTFTASAGQQYLIQIATLPDDLFGIEDVPPLSGGPGSFGITAGVVPRDVCCISLECRVSSDLCNRTGDWDGLESTPGEHAVAAHFALQEDTILPWAGSGASFNTAFCWSGVYFDGTGECSRSEPDEFILTLYHDDCGMPGEVFAGPFSQPEGTLVVKGPERTGGTVAESIPVFEFGGVLPDPVELAADTTYWIEITNSANGDCRWHWAGGPSIDVVTYQDGRTSADPDGYDEFDLVEFEPRFCVAATRSFAPMCQLRPLNDECPDAVELTEVETWVNTIGATTDPAPIPDPSPSGNDADCFLPLGDKQLNQDVWFDYRAECTGAVEISLCGSSFDSKLAVYDDLTCPPADRPLVCNDDACGPELAIDPSVRFDAVRDRRVRVRVGGFKTETGTGFLTVSHPSPDTADLRHIASFAYCFTGACAGSPCDPPLFAPACCEAFDLDSDGDVDADDHAGLIDILSGPPIEGELRTDPSDSVEDEPAALNPPPTPELSGSPGHMR